MAHDLAIPEEFGIYHTVGDTSGAGGWARRTIRNFSVFESLAEDFNKYGNGAPVLNYTNPLTTLTDVLSRLCDGPVLGLCHGLFENIHKLMDIYGIENEEEIAVNYGGLNHFFWITEARTRDIDLFSDLKKRVSTEGLTSVLEQASEKSSKPAALRELATALFNETGVALLRRPAHLRVPALLHHQPRGDGEVQAGADDGRRTPEGPEETGGIAEGPHRRRHPRRVLREKP